MLGKVESWELRVESRKSGLVLVEEGESGFQDALRVGQLLDFDGRAVNRGRVDGAKTADRGIEFVERLGLDHVGELGADAAERLLFLDDEDAVGLAHGGEHGVDIERPNGAEINDLT